MGEGRWGVERERRAIGLFAIIQCKLITEVEERMQSYRWNKVTGEHCPFLPVFWVHVINPWSLLSWQGKSILPLRGNNQLQLFHAALLPMTPMITNSRYIDRSLTTLPGREREYRVDFDTVYCPNFPRQNPSRQIIRHVFVESFIPSSKPSQSPNTNISNPKDSIGETLLSVISARHRRQLLCE